MKGKDKCEFLKSIRKQIAEEYGLDYQTTDCPHKGDCGGTCPRCDAELKDLQRQLHEKGIDDIALNVSMDEIPDNLDSQVEMRELEPLQGSLVDPSLIHPSLMNFLTQINSDPKDDNSVEKIIEMGDIPAPLLNQIKR